MSGVYQPPEDFGGNDEPTRAELREEKKQRGECRECANPVAIKKNGSPYRLCAAHVELDRKRKSP